MYQLNLIPDYKQFKTPSSNVNIIIKRNNYNKMANGIIDCRK
jgi:hypothetical protein